MLITSEFSNIAYPKNKLNNFLNLLTTNFVKHGSSNQKNLQVIILLLQLLTVKKAYKDFYYFIKSSTPRLGLVAMRTRGKKLQVPVPTKIGDCLPQEFLLTKIRNIQRSTLYSQFATSLSNTIADFRNKRSVGYKVWSETYKILKKNRYRTRSLYKIRAKKNPKFKAEKNVNKKNKQFYL